MHSHFLVFLIYTFLECPWSLASVFQRGGKQKIKGGRSTSLLNPLEVISSKEEELATMQGGATTMAVCMPLCDQKCQSVIRADTQYLEETTLFAHQSTHMLFKLLQETYTPAATGLGVVVG